MNQERTNPPNVPPLTMLESPMSASDRASLSPVAVETPPRRDSPPPALLSQLGTPVSGSATHLSRNAWELVHKSNSTVHPKVSRSGVLPYPPFRENDEGDLTLAELKRHLDKTLGALRDEHRQDHDKLLMVLHQEAIKRAALEQRFHSQLLLQSEAMVAMELKLMRLEAKAQQPKTTPRTFSNNSATSSRMIRTIEEHDEPHPSTAEPTNMAVFTSGASLASGMTAEGFLGDGEDSTTGAAASTTPLQTAHLGEDFEEDANDSDSTPTLGSRPPFGGTLESILLNPMIGETPGGQSIRATRGDTDGNSSLGTSVTGSTLTSTVVTAATRGDSVSALRYRRSLEVSPSNQRPRSRSQSPLTVQSAQPLEATTAGSLASATTFASNVAVASARSFRRSESTRPQLANRVVSFSTADLLNQTYDGTGDSITMPDELDNLSEVAESFAASARLWREEYEARLDALQKRWAASAADP